MSMPIIEWGASRGIGFPAVGLADVDRLAVAPNLDAHLEAFAVGNDGAVWHSWQQPSYLWSAWTSLSNPDGVHFNGSFGPSISVVQNADGRLEVFVVDDQWNIWHIWQAVANANWVEEWSNLGKPASPADSYSVTVAPNEINELEAFVMNVDTGEIFSRSQTEPNGGWEDGWTSLGIPPVNSVFSPLVRDFKVAAPNGTLSFQVIALGVDGNLWRNQRSRFIEGGTWTGWTMISQGPAGTSLGWLPVIRENQDRRLELLGLDPSGDNLWHTWQSSVDEWSGSWANFGVPAAGTDNAYDMHLDQSGCLVVAAWGANPATLQSLKQTAPNNGWTGWGPLREDENPNEFEEPVILLVPSPNGLLNLFSRGLGGQIYYIPQFVTQ